MQKHNDGWLSLAKMLVGQVSELGEHAQDKLETRLLLRGGLVMTESIKQGICINSRLCGIFMMD